jgi:integrase
MNKKGMGSWYLRGRIWYIKYYRNGRPFRECAGSTKEADAIELLKTRQGEIATGTFAGLGYKRITFDDLSRELLTDYKINNKKSLWRTKLSIAHLKGFFGGHKACAIDTPLIRQYAKHRQTEGAKSATINRELAALRRMFRLAVQDNRLSRVPYFPMLREDNVRTGFLEHDQYVRLLAELPEHLQPVLVMAYWTGCRKGEILGLRWSQVDFLRRQITLQARETKNREARRIPIGRELYRILQALHARRGRSEFGFTKDGEPIKYVYHYWRQAAERAGLPGLLLHDCRRSAVRNLVRAGVSDKIARAISGHKTRSVFDRYNIVDERDQGDAIAKLEEHLSHATVPSRSQNQQLRKTLRTVRQHGRKRRSP